MFCCILGCLLFLICIEFVYLYFPVLFCLSDSISHVIGCEDRLRNDLYCVEWGVKLYSTLLYCRPNLLAIIAAQKAQSIQRSVTEARTNTVSLQRKKRAPLLPMSGGLTANKSTRAVNEAAATHTAVSDFFVSFYRAMLCIRGTSHGSVSVSVCVCPSVSVTSRSSTKTAKRRITQTTPHDSPGTLVF